VGRGGGWHGLSGWVWVGFFLSCGRGGGGGGAVSSEWRQWVGELLGGKWESIF
jgi:hypothetical protein